MIKWLKKRVFLILTTLGILGVAMGAVVLPETPLEQVQRLETEYFAKTGTYLQVLENNRLPSDEVGTVLTKLGSPLPTGYNIDVYDGPNGKGYTIQYDDNTKKVGTSFGNEKAYRDYSILKSAVSATTTSYVSPEILSWFKPSFKKQTFYSWLLPKKALALGTTGLVSWWALEETSGTRADSHTVNANNLTDNNTVTGNPGKILEAGQFTRANSEYLSTADNTSLSITGSLSANCWIYKDADVPTSGIYIVMSKYDASTNLSYQLSLYNNDVANDETLAFVKSPDGTNISATDRLDIDMDTGFGGELAVATWYMVTWVFNDTADTLEIFVNGSSIGSGTGKTGGIYDGTASFMIGNQNSAGTRYFDGRIDECGIWDVALAQADINDLYNGGTGIGYSGLSSGAAGFTNIMIIE